MIKATLFINTVAHLDAALTMLHNWQTIGPVSVDACIVEAQIHPATVSPQPLAPVLKTTRKGVVDNQLQPLLENKLEGVLKSVRTLSHAESGYSLKIHRLYSDVVLMHRDLYAQLPALHTASECHPHLSPMLLLADGGQWPHRAVLPHDPLALKRLLPYKKYLLNGAEIVIVSFEESQQNEKMLMAYVQAYCKKPGYLYLTENNLDEVLRVLTPNSLWATAVTEDGPTSQTLQTLLCHHAERLNLSFLLL